MLYRLTEVALLVLCAIDMTSTEQIKYCHDAFVDIWNNCYDYYGVPPRKPPTYVIGSLLFFPVCAGNVSNLIKCYDDVIAECPETYRESQPAMPDPEGFRAFLIGSCANMHVLEAGLQCLKDKYRHTTFIDHVNKNCLPFSFFDTMWDAYFQDDWESYCSKFDTGMKCTKEKVDTYNCPGLSDFIWYSSYARQPPMCRDNSSNYAWLKMYQTIPSSASCRNQDAFFLSNKYIILSLMLLLTLGCCSFM